MPEYKTLQMLNVDKAIPDKSSKSSKAKKANCTLKVNIRLDDREYDANDGKKKSEAKELINVSAVADTGADVSCTSPAEAIKMEFKQKQLLKHPISVQCSQTQKKILMRN